MQQVASKRSGWVWIGMGALVVAVTVVVGYFALKQGQLGARPQPAVASAAAPTAPPRAEEASARPAPARGDLDQMIRTWGSKLSGDALFAKWLGGADLGRQFVAVVQLLADGESPRRMLAALAPERAFTVVEREGVLYAAPESYARYDMVARAISAIDTDRAAAAWTVLRPGLSALYGEIAPPGQSLDKTLASALSTLTTAPVPEAEMALVEKGAVYAFADPAYEALAPAQKHLVRMGPANQRSIQAKLRELQSALGLTVAVR